MDPETAGEESRVTRNTRRATKVTLLAFAAAISACCTAAGAEGSFYKGPALFSTCPSETSSLQTISRS